MHEPDTVTLTVRGRGTRTLEPNQMLLASAQGLGTPTVVPARKLTAGDWVGMQYGGDWTNQPANLPPFPDRPFHTNEKRIRVPTVMTADLAFLLGAYFSEGHTSRSNWTVTITNSVQGVLGLARDAWSTVFGLETRIAMPRNRCMYVAAASKRLVEFMELLGVGTRASNKVVPACISEGCREHALRFLQGAALDAYTTTTTVSASKWAICLESPVAINGLQDLLTKLGIPNAQIVKFNKQMQKNYYELYAPGRAGQEMCRLVPFLEPDKRARADAYVASTIGRGFVDVIPGITGPELYNLVPPGRYGRNGRGTGRQRFRHLCDPRTARVSRASVERVQSAGAPLPQWLERVLDDEVRFAPVVGTYA